MVGNICFGSITLTTGCVILYYIWRWVPQVEAERYRFQDSSAFLKLRLPGSFWNTPRHWMQWRCILPGIAISIQCSLMCLRNCSARKYHPWWFLPDSRHDHGKAQSAGDSPTIALPEKVGTPLAAICPDTAIAYLLPLSLQTGHGCPLLMCLCTTMRHFTGVSSPEQILIIRVCKGGKCWSCLLLGQASIWKCHQAYAGQQSAAATVIPPWQVFRSHWSAASLLPDLFIKVSN